MATWNEFAASDSKLAAFGAERLAGRVAYLATIRSDGSPRVHPVTPHIGLDKLFVYVEPESPKARDLLRDNRYALHCHVEDTNGSQGEFCVRGRAKVVEDRKDRDALFDTAKAAGFDPQDRYVVFELQVESALATTYENDRPKRTRWNDS